jgi:membrane protein implicated in regulation of membrane protease activity
MTWLQILGAVANLASIATAIVAVLAYWRYSVSRRDKRKRLEKYLRTERENGRMAVAVVHLVAELGMTESEVLDASFRSRHINRLSAPTLDSAPSSISLEYDGK